MTQGWAGGSILPERVATGGPAGDGDAFLRVFTNSNLATHNTSSAWTGNLASIEAGRVNVDMMSPLSSSPLEIRLVLFGPTAIESRWTSAVAQSVPNDGMWRGYTFSLAESELVRVLGLATYAEVIADVVRVMFRHDPGTPDSGGTFVLGTLNLDNIELAAADVPSGPGDFNGDGVVDDADLDDPADGWRARFGADLDGNDFLVWQRHLGTAGGGAATAWGASVPEPAGVVLGWTVVAVMLYARRGRGRPGSPAR